MPETVEKNKASQCGLSRLPVQYCSMYHISRAQCQIQFAFGEGFERGDIRPVHAAHESAGLIYLAHAVRRSAGSCSTAIASPERNRLVDLGGAGNDAARLARQTEMAERALGYQMINEGAEFKVGVHFLLQTAAKQLSSPPPCRPDRAWP
jgi:hypothetical protein